MKKGKLIVIEGIDGSGKTTQIQLFQQYLKEQGILNEAISFPRYGDNIYGKLIKRYLEGEFGDILQVNPYLIALAYAGDRLMARSSVTDWLSEGKTVIANRYVPSSKAHLGANLSEDKRQEFFKWLDELEYHTNRIPKEDLTILLDVDPRSGQKNVSGRGYDLHEESLKHLQEARQVYLELAKTQSNWQIINCMEGDQMRSPQDIHQELVKILDKLAKI